MRSHIRPSYRHDRDPARRLLAAVLWQGVKECGSRNVRHQSSARAFLAGEEGAAWLRAFGIPRHKVEQFLNGYHLNEGA
jgi:hypothetical protein